MHFEPFMHAPLAFNVRLDYPTQAQATGVGCTRIIGGDSTKTVTLCVNRTRTDGRLGFGLAYEWSSSYAERRATAAAAQYAFERDDARAASKRCALELERMGGGTRKLAPALVGLLALRH